MAKEIEKQKDQQRSTVKEKSADVKLASIDQALESLMDFGGFDLIKESVDGAGVMDPESKARRSIFLTESSKQKEREKLKNNLALWIELVSQNEDVADMISIAH